MTILATVVVLGVLIFVHELGHFAAAKAVGVQVQRFSIGLGPRVLGFNYGETEYVLSAIPLGGYVKMGGMDDEVMDRLEGGEGAVPAREPSDRDFDAKPIWARTIVISAGVIMNMVFALGVFTFLAARYGIQEVATTRVGMVDAAALPPGTEAIGTVEPGSRFVSIGGERVEHWGAVQRGLFESEPGPLAIELVEPTRSVQITVPGTEEERLDLVRAIAVWREAGVGMPTPGSPADRGGLEAGDRVIAIDGEETLNWWTFVDQIEARPGERVEVTIERDGRQLVRAVTLNSEEEAQPDGSVRVVGKAGIAPPNVETLYREASFGEAVTAGYQETVATTSFILAILRDLVTGGISPRSMGSIVTIGQASGQAAAAGADIFLRFMALFSINLAILNLLPIPVLDGGHLVFLGIEAVRGGRGLSIEQRLRWSNVGFLIIVGLMLWALSNDVLRIFGL
jgi:regulator of sigma E protease